ncbi:MAG TPA: HAMP domain-containing sensor histidine kinase [Lacipirellulaceae bacterium]|nr:HAMP domain-containing sensor histidine kinase [Lacipirellulaceae bacterium]
MRWPIRNQILLPLLAVAIVSLTAVGAINTALTERRTREHVEQQLRQVIEVLATSSFPLTNSVLRQMRDLSSAEYVLTDANGAVSASTLADAEPLPEKGAVAKIQDVDLGPSLLLGGRWYFHTPIKLPIGSEVGRRGVLHVLFPQDEYRRAWRQAFVPSFAVGAVASLLVAAVACSLANRMGRTIGRLREEVLRIARGDFRQVPLPTVDDEIRDLSLAVNRTAEMLNEYEKQVRRSEQMRTLTILGASIAHQLRNAATGCRMALDLHADECGASGRGECLDVARQQLRLMESQLQRFLRIGKRPTELASSEVDLGELIEDLLPLVRPAAQHAGVTLDCRVASGHLVMRGDEEALSQVVLNLLLNAVQAAQQHGLQHRVQPRVCVEISATTDDRGEIIVSDSGAGPADAVAGSLFEPFVTDKAEGAGLGLSVAKDIVTAHGGSIEWNRENGMTRFRVGLPLIKKGCACVQNFDC